tara:strand:+ start:344 stop:589 length:246 start_codon:yes stop_codon:yes gene_type:complete
MADNDNTCGVVGCILGVLAAIGLLIFIPLLFAAVNQVNNNYLNDYDDLSGRIKILEYTMIKDKRKDKREDSRKDIIRDRIL